ncbi:uncharacterized protein ASCRUDRAFT_76404 [Ascoidea rubescens DSM 1968]|uniref:Uncharacterized protein n=1 Tax=Ascoidea rubescens DSM 1968 TaxID=1344418 RepID=A0A1D2VFX0_9ASCO|nr:hypothetical protein ASCRUDRAFT_76404 [Ascoidea rubescens DSM 1968]ODV60413.1 hypothetical protein ASCRUDRAFT_76404 [Ascoidea rubescens DSM 1968]
MSLRPFLVQFAGERIKKIDNTYSNIMAIQNAIIETQSPSLKLEAVFESYDIAIKGIINDYRLLLDKEKNIVHELVGGYSYVFLFSPFIDLKALFDLKPVLDIKVIGDSLLKLIKHIPKHQKQELLSRQFFHDGQNYEVNHQGDCDVSLLLIKK